MNGTLFISGCVFLLFLSDSENGRNVTSPAAKNEYFLKSNSEKSDGPINEGRLFECDEINSKLSALTD